METSEIKLNIGKEERLASYEGSDKVISSSDFQKKLEEDGQKEVYSFSTGLLEFDRVTKGFETGELIVMSGYTAHGKTSFCQSLTNKFSDRGYKSIWFSYEMPPRQFFKKFGEALPDFYLPQELKGSALSWIEDRILESKIKFETRIVFIDHLHFLIDLARSGHPSLEIGTIVRSLKLLAIKYNIVIFLIAHTSMPKADVAPNIGSLRDSSFITQEADSVMVIQRKRLDSGTYGSESFLYILKHRREGIMGKKISLFYKDSDFLEVNYSNIEED